MIFGVVILIIPTSFLGPTHLLSLTILMVEKIQVLGLGPDVQAFMFALFFCFRWVGVPPSPSKRRWQNGS